MIRFVLTHRKIQHLFDEKVIHSQPNKSMDGHVFLDSLVIGLLHCSQTCIVYFSVIQLCHTEYVVLGQVYIPVGVVGITDVIYIIVTVGRAAHPQLRKRLNQTLTVVGLVKNVVLVWIQLQRDTVLLVPDRSRCGIIGSCIRAGSYTFCRTEKFPCSCPMYPYSLCSSVIGPRQSHS